MVRGQKTWSSHADLADMMITLVRTGTQQSRSAGITYLLVELDSPGITIRPIKDMSGGQHFCEVFFDEVAVPVANRVERRTAAGRWPKRAWVMSELPGR